MQNREIRTMHIKYLNNFDKSLQNFIIICINVFLFIANVTFLTSSFANEGIDDNFDFVTLTDNTISSLAYEDINNAGFFSGNVIPCW